MDHKWPNDALKRKVIKALEKLGFLVVREGNHIALEKINPNGTKTPMTIPNHQVIKGSTLRTICSHGGISRQDFLEAFYSD